MFTERELQSVLKKLPAGKAAGADETPPDFWKALQHEPAAQKKLLDLCNAANACWNQKTVPQDWRHSTVSAIFKKGDESLPENYRPISLLAVGYKVLAALLLGRLLQDCSEAKQTE